MVHIPSVEALESGDKDRLAAELRLARLQSQLADMQRLVEIVQRLTRAGDEDGLAEQLIERMTCLGCQLLEGAASLSGQRAGDSGVFVRR